MTKVYAAMADCIAVLTKTNGTWSFETRFENTRPSSLATDPFRSERLYCGTEDNGLFRSSDGGTTWEPVGPGISQSRVMSVAVSQVEKPGDYGLVYAGTEPSALFVSEDGGNTWTECKALLDLPSRSTWSYPPRPNTHHVRWIEPDPIAGGRLYVSIEQGGIMRSQDGGVTWEDRKPGGQIDGHTLATHRMAPGRVYEAAGGHGLRFRPSLVAAWPPIRPSVIIQTGGYAESRDAGASWQTIEDGLSENHYLWGLAIDAGNPDTMVASCAVGPMEAHRIAQAESFLIRRTANGPWQRVSEGVPEAKGTLASDIAAHPHESGVFYAANNRGIFRSGDAGLTWSPLAISWPPRFLKHHLHGIRVIV